MDGEGDNMSKGSYILPSGTGKNKVSETAVAYFPGYQEDEALTTISSKNQITLPAHLLREMGLGPGDRLAISHEGARLVLRARPKDWVRYHAGSLAGLYGASAVEEDAYVRELREESDRIGEFERTWTDTSAGPEK